MVRLAGIATCEICLKDFNLDAKERYTIRKNDKSGISALASHEEPELFDAIDCPHCGCQKVLQPRLRPDTSGIIFREMEEEDTDNE